MGDFAKRPLVLREAFYGGLWWLHEFASAKPDYDYAPVVLFATASPRKAVASDCSFVIGGVTFVYFL
jgi:hypothetical protein